MLRRTLLRPSPFGVPRATSLASGESISTRNLVARRSYATSPPPPSSSTSTAGAASSAPKPKSKKSISRRILSPLILGAVLFYSASVPLGLYSLRYRDFLVETIPFGEQLGNALDKYELSEGAFSLRKSTPAPGAAGGKGAKETELTRYAESRAKAEGWSITKGGKADPEKAKEEFKLKAAKIAADNAIAKLEREEAVKAAIAKAGAAQVAEAVVTAPAVTGLANPSVPASKTPVAVKELQDATAPGTTTSSPPIVVKKKETKLIFEQKPRQLDATPIPAKKAKNEIYAGPPLPVDFAPPPGYELARPPPAPKGEIKPTTLPPPPLPLVAPAVKNLVSSEPILGQLAHTIDSLAKFVETKTADVSGSATIVLSKAQGDIEALALRLEKIKSEETAKLEKSLKEQAKGYSELLLSAEKQLVERLDTQEEDWKNAFDNERKNLVAAYKEKLNKELETQQEIINQRLREEVIAQGIELQRRWVNEIKMRVEQERGGRLAKLEELEGGIRKLEKVTAENVEVMSEAVRARKIFTAVKAFEHKVDTGLPFDEELRALKRLVDTPTESSDPSLISTVLGSVPETVASAGITSFAHLASRFTSSVAPQLRHSALLPENGGVLAYIMSYAASSFLFQKEGWAEGDDVISVIARANFWLTNKDLDLATREVNQLQGWPKKLAEDWLNQARRHLEVKLALEIAEGEATAQGLKSL